MAPETTRSTSRVKGFEDPEFDFQLMRSLGAVATGGGALGECLSVAAKTKDGIPDSWVKNFTALAEMVNKEAKRCLEAGHHISARDLFYRASMYYRAAEYFEDLDSPNHDQFGLKSRDAFRAACPLSSPEIEIIEIPYDPIALPGYFARAPESQGRNKTLIILGGFDSSGEELYFSGVEALKRGFNIFFFDGPGQTGMMRLKPRLPFRPDYEVVLRPVIDYLLSRDDVDPERLALIGISFGGYLGPRAAAFDERVKALIPNSPITNWSTYLGGFFGPEAEKIPDFTSEEARSAPEKEVSPLQKRMLIHLFRKFGVDSFQALVKRLKEFHLTPEIMAKIKCPVLACIGEGEGSEPRRQCEELAKCVSGPVTKHTFTIAWGADAHCQINNLARSAQIAYDWLNDLFK